MIATMLYAAVAGGLLWYSLAKCGVQASIPVMILVGGSVIPFLNYCAALLVGDALWRRAAFAKAKAMLLLALVVIIVLRILSDEGFMRIQIGRVGESPPFFFFSSETTCAIFHGGISAPPSERQGPAIATASIIPHPCDSPLQDQLIV
jgi:hypothetical protein